VLERVRRRWPKSRLAGSNLAWWLISRTWTRWVARDFEAFGTGSLMLLPCVVAGADGITIGERVEFGPMCRMGALHGARLRFGDECEIVGGSSFFAQGEGIEIGRGVLMAWNVQIYDSHHETADRGRPIREQGVARAGRVSIGDGAWLGANVVVFPGVTIGRNAIIGANSVVTRDVPDYATAVGAPARVTDAGTGDQSGLSGPK
jgi:lipopolysaccharide O-acetyltransferase